MRFNHNTVKLHYENLFTLELDMSGFPDLSRRIIREIHEIQKLHFLYVQQVKNKHIIVSPLSNIIQ